jgi:hypothetical protein
MKVTVILLALLFLAMGVLIAIGYLVFEWSIELLKELPI